jgi:hypothetical protein
MPDDALPNGDSGPGFTPDDPTPNPGHDDGPDPADDPTDRLHRRLAYIHQTLELIAFLLAAGLFTLGGIAKLVGAGAIVILLVNFGTRYADGKVVE